MDEILLFLNEDGEFEEFNPEYTITCGTEEDFKYLKTLVRIGKEIENYSEKHELARECGSEYIMQNDKAQVDGLQLVCKIFDILSEGEE